MKNLFALSLFLLLLGTCRNEDDGIPSCPGEYSAFEVSYTIPTSESNDSDRIDWTFVSDANGTVLKDYRADWGTTKRIILTDHCTENLDFSIVYARDAYGFEGLEKIVEINTLTSVETGKNFSTPNKHDRRRIYPPGGLRIAINNIPEDLEDISFVRNSLNTNAFSLDHDNHIGYINISGSIPYYNPIFVTTKRSSETVQRGLVMPPPTYFYDNELNLDYEDFTVIIESQTVHFPYPEFWRYDLYGTYEEAPIRDLYLSHGLINEDSTQPADEVTLMVPNDSTTTPIIFRAFTSDGDGVGMSTTTLPEQIELTPTGLDGTLNSRSCDFFNTAGLDLVVASWYYFTINYEGRKYRCTWNVYLDPTVASSYTLPELPSALLDRLPFLNQLDNPTVLRLCGTQFSGSSTYSEVAPQYFYNESDRFWAEKIGYEQECVNIE
ncbi:hypothetical protein [Lewinella sp. LCG006]|uniref:hypothetical protein n=1 Tax=Lewinella sp. LCG006 TaxID=3231911 RepID=UPI00345FB4DD